MRCQLFKGLCKVTSKGLCEVPVLQGNFMTPTLTGVLIKCQCQHQSYWVSVWVRVKSVGVCQYQCEYSLKSYSRCRYKKDFECHCEYQCECECQSLSVCYFECHAVRECVKSMGVSVSMRMGICVCASVIQSQCECQIHCTWVSVWVSVCACQCDSASVYTDSYTLCKCSLVCQH